MALPLPSSPLLLPPPASPAVSPPALPPSASSRLPAALVPWLIAVAVLLALALTDACCRRRRGIGLLGILWLCPGRVFGEAVALLVVDTNRVRVTNTFEMPKWRPWRLDHHDEPMHNVL